jgi:iron-sulfur cluster assembly accessory protein
MSISLSTRAASELKDLMTSQDKSSAYLRIWVQGGGCSGLSYGMALDDGEPEDGDQKFEQDGIAVLIDSFSLSYMAGATVDFVEDAMGGGFKIENPNAVSTCGCGSSFQTQEGDPEAAGGCGCCSAK